MREGPAIREGATLREGGTLRRWRSAAQLLDGVTGRSPVRVARRLLAVQAQDLGWARLAFRARGVSRAAEVDRALTEDRTLVLGWLMRGTLHLVAAEDYAWLLALTAPGRVPGNLRRLGQEGVSPADAERALDLIRTAVRDEGPLTRSALAERVARAGIRTDGQAMPHLLLYATLRGAIVAGPLHEGHPAHADPTTWLAATARSGSAEAATASEGAAAGLGEAATASGEAAVGVGEAPRAWRGVEPRPLVGAERDRVLARLARRYLAGHGPATERDLAAWSGLPLRDARTGLAAIAAETTRDPDGLISLAESAAMEPFDDPPPRLLPAYDPYLLGWHDRAFAVPAPYARRVHPGGGTLRAVATVHGEAAGTWTIRRTPSGPRITLDPFAGLPPATEAALHAEAAAIHRFESPDGAPAYKSGEGFS